MSLAEQQRLLARLATDRELRARHLADPAEMLEEWGGGSPEARLFGESLVRAEVAHWAASLVAKRRQAVASLLPWTVRALGVRFGSWFDGHAAVFVPSGVGKHRSDAVMFSRRIVSAVKTGLLQPPWLADLAALEAGRLEALGPRRGLVIQRLRYDVESLREWVEDPGGDGAPRRRAGLAVWYRPSSTSRLRWRYLRLGWGRAGC